MFKESATNLFNVIHLKVITIPKRSNENQLQIWQLENSSSKLVKSVIDGEPSKPGN